MQLKFVMTNDPEIVARCQAAEDAARGYYRRLAEELEAWKKAEEDHREHLRRRGFRWTPPTHAARNVTVTRAEMRAAGIEYG